MSANISTSTSASASANAQLQGIHCHAIYNLADCSVRDWLSHIHISDHCHCRAARFKVASHLIATRIVYFSPQTARSRDISERRTAMVVRARETRGTRCRRWPMKRKQSETRRCAVLHGRIQGGAPQRGSATAWFLRLHGLADSLCDGIGDLLLCSRHARRVHHEDTLCGKQHLIQLWHLNLYGRQRLEV